MAPFPQGFKSFPLCQLSDLTPEIGPADSGKSFGGKPGWGHSTLVNPRGTNPLLPLVLISLLCSNKRRSIHTYDTQRKAIIRFVASHCFSNKTFVFYCVVFPPSHYLHIILPLRQTPAHNQQTPGPLCQQTPGLLAKFISPRQHMKQQHCCAFYLPAGLINCNMQIILYTSGL